MSTAYYSSPQFKNHITPHGHPERPERLDAIHLAMQAAGVSDKVLDAPFETATEADVLLCHTSRLLNEVKGLAQQGGGSIDSDTHVSASSYEVALLAVGASMAAVDGVVGGTARNAFVAQRPCGHHAESDRAMGFCLFNNVAIAARHAQKKHGLKRVAILDWDVHHGNGTQEIFYSDESVLFCSVHQSPLYPYTGAANEEGRGAAVGLTLNRPLPAYSSRAEYLEVWNEFGTAVRRFAPELIIISAGFDAHLDDPLGRMNLVATDFAAMARLSMDWAAEFCLGRLVCILEGGYDLQGLGQSVAAVIGELLNHE